MRIVNEANVPNNLRQDLSFCSYNVKTVLHGTKTLSYLGPKIWNLALLISEIVRHNKFFAKRLKNGDQMDVHVGSAKYAFLIKVLLIKNSAT